MEPLWEKIKKSVVDGVSMAAEKTEEFTKLGKAKIEILSTKRKISAKFTELGSILYDAIKEGNTEEAIKSSKVEELLKNVKALEAELDSKEEKLEDLKKKPNAEEKIDIEDTED